MNNEIRIAEEQHRFSWVTGHSSRESKPSYDQILRETKHFIIMPSLGSLVPGWMLVVPKRALENFGCLNEEEVSELRAILPDIVATAERFPGRPYIFEHGSKRGSLLSCGVDQAHLHIVPLEFDLCEQVIKSDEVVWREISNPYEVLGKAQTGEYLLISDLSHQSFHGTMFRNVSQWFRREIAKGIGRHFEWNYRQFPNFENMNSTSEVLGSSNVSRQAV